ATFTSTDIPALTSPTAGDHSLSASYAAQGNFAASTKTGTLHVNPAATTTYFNAPTHTYNPNTTVTVRRTSTARTVTGKLSLSAPGPPLSPYAPRCRSATFTSTDIPALTSPTAGDHSLSASYAAQGNFDASTKTGTLHVNAAATTTY